MFCSTDAFSKESAGNKCRKDNTTTVDCGGRGTCVCDICDCDKRNNPEEVISGTYCECDNFSCDRSNGVLCSDNGRCECGVCACSPGWSGDSCDCRTSDETCRAPNGPDQICSGHGVCKCGACQCEVDKDGRYSGKYCEKCPTCSGRCNELKECVRCQQYKKGLLTETECATNCTDIVVVGVDVVEADEKKDEHLCAFFDDDECYFKFVYTDTFKDDKLQIRAQQERTCPPKVFTLGIVLGVIAAIVLIGLAILLLWKLLTTIHDRREFARFEKERMNAKWDTVNYLILFFFMLINFSFFFAG